MQQHMLAYQECTICATVVATCHMPFVNTITESARTTSADHAGLWACSTNAHMASGHGTHDNNTRFDTKSGRMKPLCQSRCVRRAPARSSVEPGQKVKQSTDCPRAATSTHAWTAGRCARLGSCRSCSMTRGG